MSMQSMQKMVENLRHRGYSKEDILNQIDSLLRQLPEEDHGSVLGSSNMVCLLRLEVRFETNHGLEDSKEVN